MGVCANNFGKIGLSKLKLTTERLWCVSARQVFSRWGVFSTFGQSQWTGSINGNVDLFMEATAICAV